MMLKQRLHYSSRGVLSNGMPWIPARGRAPSSETRFRTEPCSQSSGQLIEKLSQLRRCLELWNGIELLERAGKRIRQAPHGSCRKLRILRLEVQAVNLGQKAAWRLKFAIDKRLIQNQLGTLVADLRTAPLLDLPLHRLKVPLDAVHAHGKRINQVEALAVLG